MALIQISTLSKGGGTEPMRLHDTCNSVLTFLL